MNNASIVMKYRRVEDGYILTLASDGPGMSDREYVATTLDDLRNKSKLIFEQELERVIAKVCPEQKGPTE